MILNAALKGEVLKQLILFSEGKEDEQSNKISHCNADFESSDRTRRNILFEWIRKSEALTLRSTVNQQQQRPS